MSASEATEYIVVPVNRDEGEIEFKDEDGKPVVVALDLADIGNGVTAVFAPADLPREHAARLMGMLKKRQRETNGDTKFVLLQGATDPDAPRWDFVRLVPKDRWDTDFNEERVDRPTT